MEPPAPASGPVFRRAASFSHRQERALKDINGRVNLLNKSQELISTTKAAALEGQKGPRPSKRFSTVASRYAAPFAAKKQLSPIADAPSVGHSNITKLPFITGRSVGHHQRRPSSENLTVFQQPPIVFTATVREPVPATTANKVNSLGAKRPRITKRASMIEKKSQEQPRASRFLSLDKGGCSCSKNSLSGAPGDAAILPGSVSLLNSAAHWLSLIKLAEFEQKHKVVIDLFRLAITLKAEPIEEVMSNLKRYQKSYPDDQSVMELLQRCEEVLKAVAPTPDAGLSETAVSKPESSDVATSLSAIEASAVTTVSKVAIIPAVVSQNLPPLKKAVPNKPTLAMGRRLSRSSTFSCVETKSQAARVTYGKKLAKTLEDLPVQEGTQSPTRSSSSPARSGETAKLAQHTPTKANNAPQVNHVEKTSNSPQTGTGLEGANTQGDAQPAGEHSTPLATNQLVLLTPVQSAGEQATPTLKATYIFPEATAKPDGAFSLEAPPCNFSTPVADMGSTPISGSDSAEKPVDSLSEWLDGESSEAGSPDIQSAPTEDTVDLSPNGARVKQMDVDTLMKEVVSSILPKVDMESPAETKAPELTDRPSALEFQIRRKSWQEPGEQSPPAEEDEQNVVKSHRHSLSAEANLLSIPGSVEKKVKLFTELAVVGVTTPGQADVPAGAAALKGHHETEAVEGPDKDTHETQEGTQPPGPKTLALQNAMASDGTKVCVRQRSTKGEDAPLSTSKADSPGSATPCDLTSTGTRRSRNQRGSGVGRMMVEETPTAACAEESPFEGKGSTISPHVQPPSSTKSTRMSRGHKEVTPRCHLTKPSWKAIVEREMKGSKLKELLVEELPKETSPLAEFLEARMENEKREAESASSAKKEEDGDNASSPAKPVRKMTRSASKKSSRQARSPTPAPIDEGSEYESGPTDAQKPEKPTEGQTGGVESSNAGCSTPGSAVRRSARIQSKVQSRRNMMFKEEFAYLK